MSLKYKVSCRQWLSARSEPVSSILIVNHTERVSSMSGKSIQFLTSTIVPSFNEAQLETCVRWFADLENHNKTIAENTYMVFELFCTVSCAPQHSQRNTLISSFRETSATHLLWLGQVLVANVICS